MKRRSGTIVPYRAAWLLAAVILLAGCTGNGPADNRNSDGISKLAIDNFAIDGQPTLGEPDAPVVVLAFEAPGCTS